MVYHCHCLYLLHGPVGAEGKITAVHYGPNVLLADMYV